MLNEQLIAELPQMLDLRVPYFDPSFEAMIRMQCKFAEDGYENMSAVQRWGFFFLSLRVATRRSPRPVRSSRYFADNVRDDYAAGQLDAQVWVSLFLNGSGSLI